MQKDELLALAKRVEALNGPDMEIFYKVRDALWPYDPATPREGQLPALLARQQFDRFVHGGAWFEASMTLVPEGYWHGYQTDETGFAAHCFEQVANSALYKAHAATPALALCAAALRALAWGE